MAYTSAMTDEPERFAELFRLADELAARDAGLAEQLAGVGNPAERLNQVARAAVEAFRRAAVSRGAPHLTQILVSGVEPDEKHVDCLQFRVARGRWEALCVVKAKGSVTLVGPFKRGQPEKPCSDQPLRGPEVEAALERLVADLIRAASER